VPALVNSAASANKNMYLRVVFVSFVACACDKVMKSLDCPTIGWLIDARENSFKYCQVDWSVEAV
jgi:hypothetical protein